MPRTITVTYEDGSSRVYQNAPDDITPEQVAQRARRDGGKKVARIDGGRSAPPQRVQPAPQVAPPPAKQERGWFRRGLDAVGNVVAPALMDTVRDPASLLPTTFAANLVDNTVSRSLDEGTNALVRRNAAQGVLPSAGGWAGFAAGAQAGNRITAPLRKAGKYGRAANVVGTFGGGLVGAFGGASAVQAGQDAALDALPTTITQPLGVDAETRAKDMQDRPYVTALSRGAPGFLFGAPGLTRLPVREGATMAERVFANPVTGAVAGAGIGGATDAAQQLVTTGQVDPGMVGISALLGASQNRNTRLGSAVGNLGARAAGATADATSQIFNRAWGEFQARRAGLDGADMQSAHGFATAPDNLQEGAWRYDDDGNIVNPDGRPFAFNEPIDAARWAARNRMGDHEMVLAESGQDGSLRYVWRRRGDAAPMQRPGTAEAPAGDADVSGQVPAMQSSNPAQPQGVVAAVPGALRAAASSPPVAGAPVTPEPVVPAQAPPPEPPPAVVAPVAPRAVDGARRVYTPTGDIIETRMKLIDAGDARYAEGVKQNRDRDRAGSEAQIMKIIAEFQPEWLGEDNFTDRGAPIIGPDGVIESGNGRMMALNRIYEQRPDLADAYRAFVQSQGFDPRGMERPVLVRERLTELDEKRLRKMVTGSNTDNKMRLSAVEQARQDASDILESVIENYRGGAITSQRNNAFVRAFIDMLPSGEQSLFMDRNGSLSNDGVARVENAMLARAFGDAGEASKRFLSLAMEQTDNQTRTLTGALSMAAPEWGKMTTAVRDGRIPEEYDLTEKVLEAIAIIADTKGAGESVRNILQSEDMYNALDPTVRRLIEAWHDPKLRMRSKQKIADFMERYAALAEQQRPEPDIFGDVVMKSRDDLLNIVIGETDEQAALVGLEDRGQPTAAKRGRETAMFDMAEDPAANGTRIDDIRRLADEIDNSLSGRAADAITTFVGMTPGAVNRGEWGGLMNARELEAIYSPTANAEALAVRKQIEAAFSPMRRMLRDKFGPTIKLYRRQDAVKRDDGVIQMSRGEDGGRNVLSWTIDREVADWFAGVEGKDPTIYSEDDIARAEAEYAAKGEVKIGRYTIRAESMELPVATKDGSPVDYFNNPDNIVWGSKDVPMIYRGEEHITDTDSVRAYMEGQNKDAREALAARAQKRSKVISAEVPINDIVWVTDRAGQMEFIVRNREGSSFYVDRQGQLTSQPTGRGVPRSAEEATLGEIGGPPTSLAALVGLDDRLEPAMDEPMLDAIDEGMPSSTNEENPLSALSDEDVGEITSAIYDGLRIKGGVKVAFLPQEIATLSKVGIEVNGGIISDDDILALDNERAARIAARAAKRERQQVGEAAEDRSGISGDTKGKYGTTFMEASFTNRPSVYEGAIRAIGMEPDKFRVLPPERQLKLMKDAMAKLTGIKVEVEPGMNLRFAIDQLLDAHQTLQGMAHVLGIAPRALSLGGKLSLKLMKKGNFLGVYYPKDGTIGLPGRSNSFAHEWSHALDYYLLDKFGAKGRGLSGAVRRDGNYQVPENLRDAFTNLMNNLFFDKAEVAAKIMELEAKIAKSKSEARKTEMRAQIDRLIAGNSQMRGGRTQFYTNAKSLDGGSREYWQSPTEMMARSLEAYVGLMTQMEGFGSEFIGKGNDNYLSNVEERFAKTFPKDQERNRIFEAFGDLFTHLNREALLEAGDGVKPDMGDIAKITDFDRAVETVENGSLLQKTIRETKREVEQRKREKEGRASDPKSSLNRVADVWATLFFSMSGQMKMLERRYGSKAIKEIHDKLAFIPGAGEYTGRVFHEEVARWIGKNTNRVTNIIKANRLEDMTPDQERMLRDALIAENTDGIPDNIVKAASGIRQVLDAEFYRNTNAGIDLGYARGSGYLKRIIDLPLVMNDQPGFVRDAGKVYEVVFDREFGEDAEAIMSQDNGLRSFMRIAKKHDIDGLEALRKINKQISQLEGQQAKSDDPDAILAKLEKLYEKRAEMVDEMLPEVRSAYATERAEAWLGKMMQAADYDFDAHSPDSSYTKSRELPPEADKLLEKFYIQNPLEAVNTYIEQSARRVAYAERFGPKGEKLKALVERMGKEGVPVEDQQEVIKIVNIATGRVSSSVSRSVQRGLSFIQAVGTMTLLPRAVISSLGESMTAGLVAGDAREGIRAFASLLSGTKSLNGKQRAELARALGIVMDNATDMIMEARFGGTYGDVTRWDRMTHRMFVNTGLVALTRAQRSQMIAASHAYLDFLSGAALAGDKNAIAELSELGVSDPLVWAKETRDKGRLPTLEELETAWGDEYGLATTRFVNMSVQNPDPMSRPMAANSPEGRVIYGITSFSFSSWRNILKRNIIKTKKIYDRTGGWSASKHAAIGFLPAALALLVLQGAVSTLREWLLNRERWNDLEKKGQLEDTLAKLAFTRTFAFGAADPFIQAYSGLKYQRDLANVMVGAAPGFLLQNTQNILNETVRDNAKNNTAEYNRTRAIYNMAIAPSISMGLSMVPAGTLTRPVLGAGQMLATSPRAGSAFATAIEGEKGSKTDPETGEVIGPPPKKKEN